MLQWGLSYYYKFMPIYLYQGLETQEVFEINHSLADLPLIFHPETQEPLKRVYTAPSIGIKHTKGSTQKILSNDNLKQNGFTKYQRDGLGKYQKIVGDNGPSTLDALG